jgi:hypothetical protein
MEQQSAETSKLNNPNPENPNPGQGNDDLFREAISGEGLEEEDLFSTANVPSEPGAQESDAVYEVDGIEFTGTRLKELVELEKKYKENYEGWDADHHKRGQELNRQESELKKKESELEKDLALGREYKSLRAIFDANPQIRDYVKQLISTPEAQMRPMIAQIEEQVKEKFDAVDFREAMVNLKIEYPDFNQDALDKLMAGFDWDKPYEQYKALYLMAKGLNFDEEVNKRVAIALQKEKGRHGAPPLKSGGPPNVKPGGFKNLNEAMQALEKDLGIKL